MEYLFTERAHLMCPRMYFGIVVNVKAAFDEAQVRTAFSALAKGHPFLRALLGYEEKSGRYFYDVTGASQTEILIKEQETPSADDPAVMAEYEHLTNAEWDLFSEGMLKAAVWKSGENTCFSLVFHHLLADGRGALTLSQELADCYARDAVPKYAPERLISSAGDFPKGSGLPLISRMLIDKANRDWKKERHAPVSYRRYRDCANQFLREDRVQYSLKKLDRAEVEETVRQCREQGVTVNDLLMARMYMRENTDKIIIAHDLRQQLAFFIPGALGNYATAFSVVMKKKKGDEFALAREIHRKVRKIISSPAQLYLVLQCYARLEPGLIDAAFMAARGGYESKAAAFIGSTFFGFSASKGYSITNLGRIENSSIETAYFIPPASPAIRMTQGVLTVNGEMTVCTSGR